MAWQSGSGIGGVVAGNGAGNGGGGGGAGGEGGNQVNQPQGTEYTLQGLGPQFSEFTW
jgi:striatin 1/3/4